MQASNAWQVSFIKVAQSGIGIKPMSLGLGSAVNVKVFRRRNHL